MRTAVAFTPVGAAGAAVGRARRSSRRRTEPGTIVKAAKTCEYVFIGSLFNLDAVTAAARGAADVVVVPCAGDKGALVLDDATCAGQIVERPAEVVPV